MTLNADKKNKSRSNHAENVNNIELGDNNFLW